MKLLDAFEDASREVAKSAVKNGPSILTGFGIVGMGLAMCLIHKAAKESTRLFDDAKSRVDEAIEEEREDVNEIKKDEYGYFAKHALPMYIPCVVVFAASSICLVKSCSINNKRVAALISSYTILDAAYKEYTEKVVQTLGKKKDEKVRDEICKDELDAHEVPNNIVCLDGEVLFFDRYRDGYFSARPDDVINAVAEINNTIFNHGTGSASVRDLYLEIDPKLARQASTDVGWNTSNPCIIRFSYQVAPNMSTCWCIDYLNVPATGYDKWR